MEILITLRHNLKIMIDKNNFNFVYSFKNFGFTLNIK